MRASRRWLALREPADAAARAPELVEAVGAHLQTTGGVTVHDLGCGTGSMARRIAASLPGPQRWIMYDRDPDLLALAAAAPSGTAVDGAPVTVETRRRDITRLHPQELERADLITASALLDMLTADELDRLLVSCASARCPVLITLSVTGRVDLTPADPLDRRIGDAFNAHQRRTTNGGALLGPDAVHAAVDGFTRLGLEVATAPSPWRLGASQVALAAEWLSGWMSAACEQRPELDAVAPPYVRRRKAEAAEGRLEIVVHHLDLLAWPGHERPGRRHGPIGNRALTLVEQATDRPEAPSGPATLGYSCHGGGSSRPVDRQVIHDELERARVDLHRLVDRATPTDLVRRTEGTRWSNRQMLFHMVFGYMIVHRLLALVRGFGRLPDRYSRAFSAVLNAGTRPFHWINYLGSCGGSLVFHGRRLTRRIDRTHDRLHRLLDAESDETLRRRMHFPVGWDPFFRDTMTLEEVYRYGTVHYRFHRAQLTLEPGPGNACSRSHES